MYLSKNKLEYVWLCSCTLAAKWLKEDNQYCSQKNKCVDVYTCASGGGKGGKDGKEPDLALVHFKLARHAFPSGTQLFHDLFQILSISFN